MTTNNGRARRFRKKYILTLCVFCAGTTIAVLSDASLGEYTAFATMLLGTFGMADVADKKLNGGQY